MVPITNFLTKKITSRERRLMPHLHLHRPDCWPGTRLDKGKLELPAIWHHTCSDFDYIQLQRLLFEQFHAFCWQKLRSALLLVADANSWHLIALLCRSLPHRTPRSRPDPLYPRHRHHGSPTRYPPNGRVCLVAWCRKSSGCHWYPGGRC